MFSIKNRPSTFENIPESLRTFKNLYLNPPKSYEFDCLSIRKFTDDEIDEISKITLKVANPGIIPNILQVIEITKYDALLVCKDLKSVEEYMENNKSKV